MWDLKDAFWVQKFRSRLLLLLLTNNSIFVSVLQVADRDKVTLHHGNITAVLTGDNGGLAIECHLIVILY